MEPVNNPVAGSTLPVNVFPFTVLKLNAPFVSTLPDPASAVVPLAT